MSAQGISLYNRHRPATFADLVGQDHLARALGNALQAGRPAHGYLFSGPRGTGKTTTARILARCLNCQSSSGPTPTPCGTCDSCRRTGHDDWLDVVEVDAASSARRIDEMREWLETVRYAPVACRYRVTIMDEAHQIQSQAASALLKTLEEPPAHLVVILCTTHPWEILGTIRSRLQQYALRKPNLAALTTVLERVARAEQIDIAESAIDVLARAAEGSFRDALGLLDQLATYTSGRIDAADARELIGTASGDTMFELVDLMASGEAAGAFELLADTLDGPVDSDQLLRALVHHLRYLCLLQQGARPRDEWGFSGDELGRLQAQANQMSAAQVVRALDLIADAQVRIRHGEADPRLQLELVAARLATPALDPDTAALDARLRALEGGRPRPAASAPVAAPPSADALEASAASAPPAAPPAPSGEATSNVYPLRPPSADAPPPAASGDLDDRGHEIPPPPGDEYAPPNDEYAPAPQEQSPPPDALHLAEPPPPSPVTAGDGPFDLDHLERRWPQVLAALQRDAPPVRGFLDDSHPLALDEGRLVIAVTSAVRASMLDNPDNREKIAEAVHALTGHRPQIAFQASAAPAQANPTAAERAEPPDGDTLLAEFKMMFNATEEGDDQ